MPDDLVSALIQSACDSAIATCPSGCDPIKVRIRAKLKMSKSRGVPTWHANAQITVCCKCEPPSDEPRCQECTRSSDGKPGFKKTCEQLNIDTGLDYRGSFLPALPSLLATDSGVDPNGWAIEWVPERA